MALRWLDSFDSYGTTGTALGINKKYNTSSSPDSSFTIVSGRFDSGYAVKLNASAKLQIPDQTANATWIIGFAYKQDHYTVSTTGAETQILTIQDSATVHLSITVSGDGQIRVRRGSAVGTLLGTTTISSGGLRPGVWYYVEIKAKIDDTVGNVTINVNAQQVLNTGNVDTRNAGNASANRIIFSGNGAAAADKSYLDDLYLCDDTGSNNTTFLGHQKGMALRPTSDSGSQQWTTSTGTDHFALVDENPYNGNTDYVQDTVSGDVDLWGYSNTSASIANIKGIQQSTVLETTDATAFSLNQRCVSGATTSDGANFAGTNGTYTVDTRVLENDPNTSALWTTGNLDSATFGIKVV